MQRPTSLVAALSALLLLLPATGKAADDAERRSELHFANFFHDGAEPLFLYISQRNGQWATIIGSSRGRDNSNHRTYNRAYYAGRISDPAIHDGKVKGKLTLFMTPDSWVPLDHRPYTIEMEIDADVSGEKAAGQYHVIAVDSTDKTAEQFKGKSGAIDGITKPGRQFDVSGKFALQLSLQGAIIGNGTGVGDRCLQVRIGFEGGKLVAAEAGRLNLKQDLYDVHSLTIDPGAIQISPQAVKARWSLAIKTLDEEPAHYDIDIDGGILDETVAGVDTFTISVDGKTPVKLSASFDGRLFPGMTVAPPKVDDRPWWKPAAHYQPLQPGEHPRLLFRKGDLPALRAKAQTPEGKAIIERLRRQLNGTDGETLAPTISPATQAYDKQTPKDLPLGTYTMSHVAGYGLLYQLTGDMKYAELGRKCFEMALAGKRDRDDRFSWVAPGGSLRAGPTVGWYALGYDLCYDGWDDATREKFCKAIAEYNAGRETRDAGGTVTLDNLVRGDMPPSSNHFGLEVGGSAMALLAVTQDKWVDQQRIDKLLKVSEQSMIREMTEGFGDGGFFAEGDGTGSMSSHISFLTALQAWNCALGHDYVHVDRPNARMMALKWMYLTVFRGGKPDFWPIRGAYGHNVWNRESHGMGYTCIGLGVVNDDEKTAMKWYYNHFLRTADEKAGMPFDATSPYPHSSICALVNWPIDLPERNPAEVLPLCYRDSTYGFYAWRNRWQDENDIVISLLTRRAQGYMESREDGGLQVAAFGKKFSWGVNGDAVKEWWTSPNRQASVLTFASGPSIAVDFTGASGAEGLLISTGPADGKQVSVGSDSLTFKFLTAGAEPQIVVNGSSIEIGRQTVAVKDGKIVLGAAGVK